MPGMWIDVGRARFQVTSPHTFIGLPRSQRAGWNGAVSHRQTAVCGRGSDTAARTMKIEDTKGFGKTHVTFEIDSPYPETAKELDSRIRDVIKDVRDGE